MTLGSITAFAQAPVQGPIGAAKEHRHQMMKQIMNELNLSKGQRDEIKGIHERAHARMKAIKASNVSIDAKKAEAKNVHLRSKEEVMKVLTPAQREKLKAIQKSMHLRSGVGHV